MNLKNIRNISFDKKIILKELGKPLVLLTIFSLLVIAAYLVFYTVKSLDHIIAFNGYAANGAFQLMNPLERMNNGQIIGRDFQFFHGPGVLLAHWPLFKIFGSGLFGSEMSRWFTSLLLFTLTGFLFCYAWFFKEKDTLKKTTFALALLFILTSLTSEVITPSNSLLGVRTTVPIFIGILLLLRPTKIFKFLGQSLALFDILLTLLLALAITFGTEQGIAALAAILILEFANTLYKHRSLSVLKSLFLACLRILWLGLLTGIFLLVTFTMLSLGHPIEALRYVLSEVPNEQFWYFGGEPQGFLTYKNLAHNMTSHYLLQTYALVITAAGLIYYSSKKQLIGANQALVSMFLLIYGLVSFGSILSYFYPTQAIPLSRAVTLIISMIICSALFFYLSKKRNKYLIFSCIIICIILLFISVRTINQASQFQVKKLMVAGIANLQGNHETLLGIEWNERIQTFQPDINSVKEMPVPLWSTYASLYEQSINTMHPSSQGHDYIIHALGPDRRQQYAQDFITTKPALVTTLRQSYFIFEEWLWARHWDFYLPLIENYKIIKSNDSHFLWKQAEPIKNSKDKKDLSIVDDQIKLPSYNESTSELIEVTVTYSTDSHWSKVPFAKKLPRYMLRPHNTISTIGVSLPPYETKWVFPIVLDKTKSDANLVFSADGLLPGAKLNITNAQYRPIKTYPENLIEFTERYNSAN